KYDNHRGKRETENVADVPENSWRVSLSFRSPSVRRRGTANQLLLHSVFAPRSSTANVNAAWCGSQVGSRNIFVFYSELTGTRKSQRSWPLKHMAELVGVSRMRRAALGFGRTGGEQHEKQVIGYRRCRGSGRVRRRGRRPANRRRFQQVDVRVRRDAGEKRRQCAVR